MYTYKINKEIKATKPCELVSLLFLPQHGAFYFQNCVFWGLQAEWSGGPLQLHVFG